MVKNFSTTATIGKSIQSTTPKSTEKKEGGTSKTEKERKGEMNWI